MKYPYRNRVTKGCGSVERIAYKYLQSRLRGHLSTLILSVDLHKLGQLLMIAPSSNGKTADSGSAYRGSNPCGAAGSTRKCHSSFFILHSSFFSDSGLIV